MRLMLCAALLAVSIPASAEVISSVAALVNDDIITSYEIRKEMQPLEKEAEKKAAAPLAAGERERLYRETLNRLVDKKLVDQKIRELNIRIGEEELRQAIDDVKKQNNLTQEALVAALATQGLSYDQYKAQIRDQLERLRLIGQEVRSKIQVGEREMKDFYEGNKELWREEEKLKARHIFFKLPPKPTAKELKAAMEKALLVRMQALKGADFTELAKKYSEDPSGKEGGVLGSFSRSDMTEEFQSVLDGLKPGQVSELIQSPSGFHIVKVDDVITGKVKPYEQVKNEIEERLYRKKSEDRFNQWVSDLRKNATIDIRDQKAFN